MADGDLPAYGQPIAKIDLTELLAAISGQVVTSVNGTPNQVTVVPTTGAVVVGLPSSGILPGAWHAATGFVVDAGNLTVTVGNVVITAGTLNLSAAASRIIPGATSLSLRNNANSADNLLLTDAGIATLRNDLLVGGAVDLKAAFGITGIAVQVTSATVPSAIFLGQDATHGIELLWQFNAIAANAIFKIRTFGTTNAIFLEASEFQLIGHLKWQNNNTYDIGGAGTTSPRSVYVGTSFLGPDGSAAAVAFGFASTLGSGMYRLNGFPTFSANGTPVLHLTSGPNVVTRSDGSYAWSSTTTLTDTLDLFLSRDAANTLAQRNGTNAQTFRVYETYGGAGVDYSRIVMGMTSTAGYIQTQAGGTGVLRPLYFTIGATDAWRITTGFHLQPIADNTYDIGASGATRPRTIYVGTSVKIAGMANAIAMNGASLDLGSNPVVGVFDLTFVTTSKVSPVSGVMSFQVRQVAITQGSDGSLILPYANMTGAANDAARDVLAGNVDGAIAIDSGAANKIWARKGGVWYSIAVI